MFKNLGRSDYDDKQLVRSIDYNIGIILYWKRNFPKVKNKPMILRLLEEKSVHAAQDAWCLILGSRIRPPAVMVEV